MPRIFRGGSGMEVNRMQQKKNLDYPEAISMEEYLAKRKKIKEGKQNKGRRTKDAASPVWMLAELYV